MRSQEHAGNDPTTQLVPASSGSGGTWTKPEEQDVPPGQQPSSIAAVSTWASQPRQASVVQGPWQPSGAPRGQSGSASDRLLNPEEYPSLASAKESALSKPEHSVSLAMNEKDVHHAYILPQEVLYPGSSLGR